MSESMMSAEQVAQRLGVAAGTIREWCRTGELPARQLAGRVWRVDPADLEQWLERQRPAPTAPEHRLEDSTTT